MKVSICCITYNHEPYIAECIEGFLRQKTDFDVEIIIGEDHSLDKTLPICFDYQKKYPDKIKILSRDRNIGMMANLLETFGQCKGTYIAFCEGDDYWTDPLKLQKQFNFLENNPEYAVCCHDYWLRKGNRKYSKGNKEMPEVADITYLLRNGNYIGTLTAMYRNHPLVLHFLQKFPDAPFGDMVMHTGAALNGKIKYMKEKMAVYRVHDGGAWTTLSTENGVLKNLSLLEMLYQRMPHEYKDDLKIQCIGWLSKIVRIQELSEFAQSQELKNILKRMDIPPFVFEYVKFNNFEKSHYSYYTRHVSLQVLLRAVGSKLVKKIVTKNPS